jgi:simple sugar transport system permease protein
MDAQNSAVFVSLFIATIRSAGPVVLTALGLIHTSRAGVYYLGIEGSMMLGVLGSFVALHLTGSYVFAVLAGMLMGGLLTLLHGLLVVTIGLDNAVVGVMLGTVGFALADFLGRPFLTYQVKNLTPVDLGVLSDLPVAGPIFFQQNVMVYITVVLIVLSYVVFRYTRLGSCIISVGDNPKAADAVGIKVVRVRYLSLLYGGMLIGMGGAYLTLNYSSTFVPGITAGRGWIAFALMIFARYNPLVAGLGGLLFGGMEALEFRLGILNIEAPVYFLKMMPYIATVVVLVLGSLRRERKYPSEPQSEEIAYRRD